MDHKPKPVPRDTHADASQPDPASPSSAHPDAAEHACSVCGSTPASATGMSDPDLGSVYLCSAHRDRSLDWT
jgi:hypothetical protein